MLSKLLFVFVVTILNFVNLRLITLNAVNQVSISECILKASLKFLNDTNLIAYLYCSNDISHNMILEKHFEEERWLLLTQSYKQENTTTEIDFRPQAFIISINYLTDIVPAIKVLKKRFPHCHRAKFIITSETVFQNPTKIAEEIMEHCRKEFILNVVVLLETSASNSNILVLTWFPYNNESNCGQIVNVTNIDNCNNISTNWFDKIPENLNNCTVKVTHFHAPPGTINPKNNTKKFSETYFEVNGVDYNILSTIGGILNVTILYYESPFFGNILQNGTPTGQLIDTTKGRMDIAISGYAISVKRFQYLDSIIYTFDSAVCCAPYIKIAQNQSGSLLTIFSEGVWISTTLLFIMTSVLMWYFSKRSKKEHVTFKRLENTFLFNFSALLSTTTFRTLPFTPEVRYLVAFIVFANFILDSFYTTYLASILSRPMFYEKYKTIDDMYNSDLKTYIVPVFIEFIVNQSDIPPKNWLGVVSPYKIYEDVAYKRDTAICMPSHRLHYETPSYVNSIGDRLIHCYYDRPIYSYNVGMLVHKGFPFYEQFSRIVSQLTEAGFIAKWLRATKAKKLQNVGISETENSDKEFLTFKELWSVFVILLIGHAIGVLVFISENIFFILKNKKRANNRY